jgi:hypothetical protein
VSQVGMLKSTDWPQTSCTDPLHITEDGSKRNRMACRYNQVLQPETWVRKLPTQYPSSILIVMLTISAQHHQC